jgi:hypothetical protein
MNQTVKEIYITVVDPPPVTVSPVTVSPVKVNNYIISNISNIPNTYGFTYRFEVECQFFWWRNKKLILLCVFLFISLGISMGVYLGTSNSSSTTTSTNPCETYKMDDLANTVTLRCFNYIWTNSGCNGFVPSGYMGWWLRSPEGGKTIPCVPPNIGERCGAGNYATIINNIFVCDLNYRGY